MARLRAVSYCSSGSGLPSSSGEVVFSQPSIGRRSVLAGAKVGQGLRRIGQTPRGEIEEDGRAAEGLESEADAAAIGADGEMLAQLVAQVGRRRAAEKRAPSGRVDQTEGGIGRARRRDRHPAGARGPSRCCPVRAKRSEHRDPHRPRRRWGLPVAYVHASRRESRGVAGAGRIQEGDRSRSFRPRGPRHPPSRRRASVPASSRSTRRTSCIAHGQNASVGRKGDPVWLPVQMAGYGDPASTFSPRRPARPRAASWRRVLDRRFGGTGRETRSTGLRDPVEKMPRREALAC